MINATNSQMVQEKNANTRRITKWGKILKISQSNEFHEFFALFFQVFVSLTLFQNKKF